jgi:cullin-5
MAHQEDQALLKAYISSWRKFFIQCSYLPMPFHQLELALLNKPPTNNAQKKSNNDESIVRKVYIFSIKCFNQLIKINLIE